jgi:hypothetical protein
MNPQRRGLLVGLAAAMAYAPGWRRATPPPPTAETGPRELSLQQADYYRPHDLAG